METINDNNYLYPSCEYNIAVYAELFQKKVTISFKIRNFSQNEMKIWILHNSRTGNSNMKSDFGYLNYKCLKIAIEKSKNGEKSIRHIFFFWIS